MRPFRPLLLAALLAVAGPGTVAASAVLKAPLALPPSVPPLSTSANVELLGNIPGSVAGLAFKDHYAFATGWANGLLVLDVSVPENPTPVGALALPHFENEDVDLCGDTLLIANDRIDEDYGSRLYIVDIAQPEAPALASILPLGGTGERRGSGHIANFVSADCSQVWVDGGEVVEVVDLSDPTAPASLGFFESAAADSEAFHVTHDSELDPTGVIWSVGGGGAAGYRLTADPLSPELVTSTSETGVNLDFTEETSPYNDFILHNSKRYGDDVLLITEEDYVDTDEAQPGSCHGQGKFETWSIANKAGKMEPLDTWMTELNAADSKAPATVNCSSHWFEERDGVAAVGWYEQGVRFLDVRNPEDIRQVGYYLPVNGSTWAAYWVPGADDIVYATDVYRGIDVLRVGDTMAEAGGPTVAAPILPAWTAPAGVAATRPAFRPSATFGWACPVPVS